MIGFSYPRADLVLAPIDVVAAIPLLMSPMVYGLCNPQQYLLLTLGKAVNNFMMDILAVLHLLAQSFHNQVLTSHELVVLIMMPV